MVLDEAWWRDQALRYRVDHRKATPARWDAFAMALRWLVLGREVSATAVRQTLNGGNVSQHAVDNGVRDARALMYRMGGLGHRPAGPLAFR